MKEMQLILSGNPNLRTVDSVVYFASATFSEPIDKVHFLDTAATLYRDGQSIEGERNDLVRRHLRSASIVTSLIDPEDIHLAIPRIMSEELRAWGKDRIIVDLTNGTKSISNVLYASASLSKISNLFFLSVSRERHRAAPHELKEGEYQVTLLPALDNIGAIGAHSFFEIVYYLDKVNDIVASYNSLSLENEALESGMTTLFRGAVQAYFRGEYAQSIQGVGQLAEGLADALANRIDNAAQASITAKRGRGFAATITWLRSYFCEPLRGKLARDETLEAHEQSLKLLVNVYSILELIRVYRNFSSHAYDMLRGPDEAKLVLSNAFYLFELVHRSNVFAPCTSQ